MAKCCSPAQVSRLWPRPEPQCPANSSAFLCAGKVEERRGAQNGRGPACHCESAALLRFRESCSPRLLCAPQRAFGELEARVSEEQCCFCGLFSCDIACCNTDLVSTRVPESNALSRRLPCVRAVVLTAAGDQGQTHGPCARHSCSRPDHHHARGTAKRHRHCSLAAA